MTRPGEPRAGGSIRATTTAWFRSVLRAPRRLGRTSLRLRLLLITMLLLVLGSVVSNTIVIDYLHRYQVDRIDDRLRPIAMLLTNVPTPLLSRSKSSSAEVPRTRALTEGFDLMGDPYFAVVARDGTVEQEVRSPRHADDPGPELSHLDAKAVADHGGNPFNVPGDAGSESWRVVAVSRDSAGDSMVVAVSLAEVNATIDRLRTGCLLIGAAVFVLLAGAGWFAVRGGLRPLGRIEQTAAAIADGDLSRRVPDVAAPGTEVGRLSVSLNRMLAQIEAGVTARVESEARMRRFVADVGHELRTPLAGIKGFAELYRMGGLSEAADVDRTMGRIESESTRMVRLVEDLLLLARLDERDPPPLDAAPMDLRTLAADALHDLRALDPARPVRLTGPDGGPPGTAPVSGDEARLRQVVTNLVGNAVAHTPAGTPVRVGVGVDGADAVLEVADQGPGLARDQAARIFERFYRVDRSRSRTTGGAGLGLSIASSLVDAHDGRIDVCTAPGEGARFRIRLPATTEPRDR